MADYLINDFSCVAKDAQNRMEELLVGRSIVSKTYDSYTLDNGVTLKIIPNDGGCTCGSGDYFLQEVNDFENVITRVKLERKELGYKERDEKFIYSVYVYAANKKKGAKQKLFSVSGSDGNGYYGTGYRIEVYVEA